ncbi:MAG: hypothetical protein II024_05030 [Firmicutes bacterium]|nr:hypothetical protein [Bacillota bacterium]
MNGGLNRNQIKYIVILAMLVDHIAWLFVYTYSVQGELMHFFGRLTGPTMAVFIAEGYRYTKNVKHYLARLGVFAIISWPCFSLMETGRILPLFSVIYTYFLALVALIVWDSKTHIVVRLVIIGGLIYLSKWGDWSYMGILFALAAHIWHDNKTVRWSLHTLICLVFLFIETSKALSYGWPWWTQMFQAGTLMVAPMMLYLYNGESGSKAPFHKWFFYVFYPLHMLMLWYLRFVLFR